MCWCFSVLSSSISVSRFSVDAAFRLDFNTHFTATTSREPLCTNYYNKKCKTCFWNSQWKKNYTCMYQYLNLWQCLKWEAQSKGDGKYKNWEHFENIIFGSLKTVYYLYGGFNFSYIYLKLIRPANIYIHACIQMGVSSKLRTSHSVIHKTQYKNKTCKIIFIMKTLLNLSFTKLTFF